MYYVRYCSYIKSQCAVVGMGRIRAYRASQPQVHFKQIFLGSIGVVWHSIFFFYLHIRSRRKVSVPSRA